MRFELHREDVDTDRFRDSSIYVLDSMIVPITDDEDGTIGTILSTQIMVQEPDDKVPSKQDLLLIDAKKVLEL